MTKDGQNPQPAPDTGRALLHAHLNGEALSDDQRAALSDWVCASKENAELAAEMLHLDQAIRAGADRLSQNAAQWLTADPDDSGAAEALAELAKLHEEGLNQPISLEAHRKEKQQHAQAHRRVQRKARLILAGSFAALIAVAALAGLLLSALTQQPQPIVEQPADAVIVATLTDVKDAKWETGEGDAIELNIGDTLLADTLLELTEGFAEITTNRGAIAIIEAPATLELLDNDNALRLHAGKLVGICETESSKGFLVRTPHMDVTDLGTRFGVAIDGQRQTLAEVFEGSIETYFTAAATHTTEPIQLSKGASLALGADGQRIDPAGFETQIFTSLRALDQAPQITGGPTLFDAVPPTDLRQGRQVSEKLQVYLERSGVLLKQPVPVDLAGQRNAWPTTPELLQPLHLGQGGRVDIYLLHMDQTGIDKSSPVYTLDFGRPILGVIAHPIHLEQTDPLAGAASRRFDDAPDSEGKLLRGIEKQDTVNLLPGGESMQVQMHVVHKTDQVRVIVAAEPPQPEPLR